MFRFQPLQTTSKASVIAPFFRLASHDVGFGATFADSNWNSIDDNSTVDVPREGTNPGVGDNSDIALIEDILRQLSQSSDWSPGCDDSYYGFFDHASTVPLGHPVPQFNSSTQLISPVAFEDEWTKPSTSTSYHLMTPASYDAESSYATPPLAAPVLKQTAATHVATVTERKAVSMSCNVPEPALYGAESSSMPPTVAVLKRTAATLPATFTKRMAVSPSCNVLEQMSATSAMTSVTIPPQSSVVMSCLTEDSLTTSATVQAIWPQFAEGITAEEVKHSLQTVLGHRNDWARRIAEVLLQSEGDKRVKSDSSIKNRAGRMAAKLVQLPFWLSLEGAADRYRQWKKQTKLSVEAMEKSLYREVVGLSPFGDTWAGQTASFNSVAQHLSPFLEETEWLIHNVTAKLQEAERNNFTELQRAVAKRCVMPGWNTIKGRTYSLMVMRFFAAKLAELFTEYSPGATHAAIAAERLACFRLAGTIVKHYGFRLPHCHYFDCGNQTCKEVEYWSAVQGKADSAAQCFYVKALQELLPPHIARAIGKKQHVKLKLALTSWLEKYAPSADIDKAIATVSKRSEHLPTLEDRNMLRFSCTSRAGNSRQSKAGVAR